MKTTISGTQFDIEPADVEDAVRGRDPDPIVEHYVVVAGRRYPPKQVLATVTGLDRADFTTHQARNVLRRLGYGVYRRGQAPAGVGGDATTGSGQAALSAYAGRWVAEDNGDVLFDADSRDAVVAWVRRHGKRATVWRIPGTAAAAGSGLSTP